MVNVGGPGTTAAGQLVSPKVRLPPKSLRGPTQLRSAFKAMIVFCTPVQAPPQPDSSDGDPAS